MNVAILFALLLKIATVENWTVNDGSKRNAAYLDGVRIMTEQYVAAGSAGLIVSPEVDPILLAVIGYEESRHRPRVNDGDCYFRGSDGKICQATGPMQLHKAMPRMLPAIDPAWKGLTLAQLKEPETSVRAAYRLLGYYKSTCKGASVAALLGSWSAGKCVGEIALGRRRCALASAIGAAAGVDMSACATKARSNAEHIDRAIAALAKAAP